MWKIVLKFVNVQYLEVRNYFFLLAEEFFSSVFSLLDKPRMETKYFRRFEIEYKIKPLFEWFFKSNKVCSNISSWFPFALYIKINLGRWKLSHNSGKRHFTLSFKYECYYSDNYTHRKCLCCLLFSCSRQLLCVCMWMCVYTPVCV